MAFLDYVPFVSTFKHAFERLPGEKVDDYRVFLDSFEISRLAKRTLPKEAAGKPRPSKTRALAKRGEFRAEYSKKPLVSDLAEAALGTLVRQAIKNFLVERGLSTAAATLLSAGIGTLLALDGALDAAIQVRKQIKIRNAAAEATSRFGAMARSD